MRLRNPPFTKRPPSGSGYRNSWDWGGANFLSHASDELLLNRNRKIDTDFGPLQGETIADPDTYEVQSSDGMEDDTDEDAGQGLDKATDEAADEAADEELDEEQFDSGEEQLEKELVEDSESMEYEEEEEGDAEPTTVSEEEGIEDEEAVEYVEEVQDEEMAKEYAAVEEPDEWFQEYSLDAILAHVYVQAVEGKGRCLFAEHDYDPGDIIFIEAPILAAHPDLDPNMWAALSDLHEEEAFELPPVWHLAALCSIQTLEKEKMASLLSRWVPDPQVVPSADVLRVMEYLEIDVDPQLYERCLQAWRYNSFGHHTASDGLICYDNISSMAHSCNPSATWHYGHDDLFVLRAREKLKRGDEITISYIGDEDLIKSRDVRRAKLEGWLFTCECATCTSVEDTARGFLCPNCGVGSIFFQSDVGNSITATPCKTCGHELNSEGIEEFQSLETQYVDRLDSTNKDELEDAEAVYREAVNVFSQHWVLFQLSHVLSEGYKDQKRQLDAVHHLLWKWEYMRKVTPKASFALVWLYDEIGDTYRDMFYQSNEGEPLREFQIQVLKKYYSGAVNLLQLLCGDMHQYSRTALEKLSAVLG